MPWITVSPQISFLVLVHTDWNVHWHSSIMVTTATEQLHNMRLRESRQEVYCDSGPRTKLGHRGVGCTIWHTDQNLLRRTFISWWFFNVYLLRFSTCCCSFVVVIVLSLSLSLFEFFRMYFESLIHGLMHYSRVGNLCNIQIEHINYSYAHGRIHLQTRIIFFTTPIIPYALAAWAWMDMSEPQP